MADNLLWRPDRSEDWLYATVSSVERCAGAYESLAVAIAIWDRAGNLWYANGAALLLWAAPLHQLRGIRALELLDTPSLTGSAGPDQGRQAPGRNMFDGDTHIIRSSGERIAVHVHTTTVIGPTPEERWHLSTIVDRPAVVDRMHDQTGDGEILLERDLLQTLMDSAPDQVYIKDRKSRFTFANKAQAAYFGARDPAEVLGKTDFDFFATPVAKMLFDQEQSIMRTGVALVGAVEDQSAHFGRPWWVQSTKVPITRQGEIVGLVGISRNITDLKLIQEQFAHSALHDPLTGLPNRTLLLDRLEHGVAAAKRENTCFGLCMIDVNRFKTINDMLGHRRGDRALQEVARRLSATLRQADTMARLGGDEFAVLLPGATVEGSVAAAERLSAALAEPADLGGCQRLLSVSVGIAVYPQHAADAAALLDCADAAMYAAKISGQSFMVFHRDHARESTP